ncbi:hypothetical protein P152DRAFT_399220, partial [Eremomyces bilateralis CBS 781.70]
QPICSNCQTKVSPLWRRDDQGAFLCNACGLYLKLHGKSRPLNLKTDVIKSRNRVKPTGQKRKLSDPNGPAPSSTHSTPRTDTRPDVRKFPSAFSDRSGSPISRTTTPGLHHPSAHIAPQHLFDAATLNNHAFPASDHPRPRSPGDGAAATPGDTYPSYEYLSASNTTLRIRVNELEVINGLFGSRIEQLEANEVGLRERLTEQEESADAMDRMVKALEKAQARVRAAENEVERLKKMGREIGKKMGELDGEEAVMEDVMENNEEREDGVDGPETVAEVEEKTDANEA